MDSKPSFLSNIIAAIGFFFLVIILIWGLLNITRWAPSVFGSITSLFGTHAGTTLVVSVASSTVASGTTTEVSWDHVASKGTYAFTYTCTASASIDVPTGAGGFTLLPCGSAYVTDAAAPKSIQIVPHATVKSITLPITVTYRDEKNVAGASGASTLTITNATVGSTPSTANTGGTTGTGTKTPSGKPDLSVSMIGIGVMLNGVFTPSNYIGSGDTAAIRFSIKNVGSAPTGTWRFRATLPTNPAYVYDSVAQSSLGAGDRIEYTLKFTNLAQGGGIVTVVADPQHAVAESNESNNTLTYQIAVQQGYTNY